MLARLSQNHMETPLVYSDSESNPCNLSDELTTNKQVKRKRKVENIPHVKSGCFSMICQKTIRSQEEIYEAHLTADGRELPTKYKWIAIEDPKAYNYSGFIFRNRLSILSQFKE